MIGTWIGRLLTNPYGTLVSRLVLGGVFLLAGLTKLGVPAAFRASINSYEMPLPEPLVEAMAQGLPAIEVGLGLWLLLGLFTRASAAVAGGLMLVFLVGLTQAWVRGLEPDCGCFSGPDGNRLGLALLSALGPLGRPLLEGQVGLRTFVRDLIFLAMAAHLVFVPTVFALDNWRQRRAAPAVEEVDEPEMLEEPTSEPAGAHR